MIRGRLPDEVATYPDPTRGVNLRKSLEDLEPGEAELMQNCYWDSDIRKRPGAARWTTVSLGMSSPYGGHKAYFSSGAIRMVAFGTNVVQVSDAGILSTMTSTLTAGSRLRFQVPGGRRTRARSLVLSISHPLRRALLMKCC